MSKNKNKLKNKAYIAALEKFGLLPQFDLSKKEKKIIKLLAKNGDMDALAIGEALDFKPEKVQKLIARLMEKGAVEEQNGFVKLSPLALRYLHAKKDLAKSAKQFYRFLDALSEKEIEEFMQLVYSFKIQPVEPEGEAPAPVEEPAKEEPKPEEKPARKPRGRKPKAEGEAPAEKSAPKARAPRKPRTPRKPRAPKAEAPKQEEAPVEAAENPEAPNE